MTNAAQANKLAEYVYNHPFVTYANGKQESLTATLGMGSGQNGLSLEGYDSLRTNNNGFYILGLSINKAVLQFDLPYKSDTQLNSGTVDSDIAKYSFSYNLMDNLHLEAAYRKRAGFYVPNTMVENTAQYKFQDLSIKQYSVSAVYAFETGHKSFLVDPILYNRMTDSSSVLLISRANHSEFSGLESLSVLPLMAGISKTSSSVINSLEMGVAYSKNAFWEHWFIGGAFGIGYSLNVYKTKIMNESKSIDSVDTNLSSNVVFSLGYVWTSLKTGLFAHYSSWRVKLEGYEITDNSGSTGLYLGYDF